MNPPEDSDQTTLRDYVRRIWARKVVAVIVFLVAVGGTLGYCVIVKAKYTGTSEILLEPSLSPLVAQANNGFATAPVVDVPSDIQVIESPVVKSLVEKIIPNAPTVSAVEITTTDVVQLSTTSTDKNTAAQAADQYAKSYIAFEQGQTIEALTKAANLIQNHINTVHVAISTASAQLSGATGAALTTLDADIASLNQEAASLENNLANVDYYLSSGAGAQSGQIIGFASIPTKPSSPKTVEYTVIGALVGLILGIAAAMLVDSLAEEPKVRTSSSASSRVPAAV